MQEIIINPLNTYSCQFCHKEFKTKLDYYIIEGFSPICTHKCLYKFIYNILKEYCEKELYFLSCHLFNTKKKDFNEKRAVYSLTKYFAKYGLSSINIVVTSDKTKKRVTNGVAKKSDKIGDKCVYIETLVTLSLWHFTLFLSILSGGLFL